MRCDAMQCDTIRYNTIQYIQYSTIQYNAIQYNTIQNNTIHAMQYNTIRYKTIPYMTIHNNTKQYNIIQCENFYICPNQKKKQKGQNNLRNRSNCNVNMFNRPKSNSRTLIENPYSTL